jgi:serine/threonine protein kinase/Tfp pilus assembly protein PilF
MTLRPDDSPHQQPDDLPDDPLFTYAPQSTLPPPRPQEEAPNLDLSSPSWSVAWKRGAAEEITSAAGAPPSSSAGAPPSSSDKSGASLENSDSLEPPSLALLPRAPAVVSPTETRPVYQLGSRVASGGMGEIWEARQISLGGRVVAVKRIRGDVLDMADAPARRQLEREFRQEALATASLEHPGIVPVHDLGADDEGQPLLAMKLVRGQPWHKLLREDFESGLSDADRLAKHLPILVDVTQAVAFAHSRGIVHRDLKPAQVMIGRFGETLLMDWGLAIFMPQSALDPERLDDGALLPEFLGLPTCETASNPAGTPALMAPEQTEPTARNIGPWTDVYLLGGTLYYLLTGAYIHGASGGAEFAMERAAAGKVDLPEVRAPNRDIPAELSDLAMRALAKEPAERVPSAEAFLQLLQDYLSGASKRRESLALAQEAESDLEALLAEAPGLKAPELYIRHGDIAEKLGRASRLWPNNPDATETDARNLAARVVVEIDQGDLLLAQVHLSRLKRAAARGFFDAEETRALEEYFANALHARAMAKIWRRAFFVAACAFFLATLGFGVLATLNAWEAARERDRAQQNLSIATRQGQGAYELILYIFDELKDSMEAELAPESGLTVLAANKIKHAIAGAVAAKTRTYFESLNFEDWPQELKVEHAARLVQTATRLADLGRVEEGKKLALEALEIREETLGRSAPDTADAVEILANFIQMKGDWAQAEPLFRRVLAIRERTLAAWHPATAIALNNLAMLFAEKGNAAEAEPLHRRALAIREKALGPDHPDTAQSLNNLASLLYSQGRWTEAEPLFRRALAIREKALGPNHPDTATCLDNLASLLNARGDWAQAEPLLRRALAIREKAQGPHHPDTAISLNNLATRLREQGNWAEAEPLFRRALAIQEKALGADHPEFATFLNNLAIVLKDQGNIPEAESLSRRALAIREKVLGPDHSDVADSLNTLASFFNRQGDWTQAEAFLRRALAINEKALGPDHPATALALQNLASVLQEQGNWTEAEPLCRRALAIREKVLGPDHLDTAEFLNILAYSLRGQGDVVGAETLCRRALAIREKALGSDNAKIAIDVNNLAILLASREPAEAASLFRRALAIREKTLGPDHPETATSLHNLALMLFAPRKRGRSGTTLSARLGHPREGSGRRSPERPGHADAIDALAPQQRRLDRRRGTQRSRHRRLAPTRRALS